MPLRKGFKRPLCVFVFWLIPIRLAELASYQIIRETKYSKLYNIYDLEVTEVVKKIVTIVTTNYDKNPKHIIRSKSSGSS